jgi:hypothetical protein
VGFVRLGPPTELVDALRTRLGASVFVETGSFRGDTVMWAAGRFERVVSVELSPELYRDAERRVGGSANVELHLGDSREVLAEVVPGIAAPAIFWLDAHWCGDETAGRLDECPLLGELQVIRGAQPPPCVLVDDARFFLAPPAGTAGGWPSIWDVYRQLDLAALAPPVVVEDVIVAVPHAAQDILVTYAQDVARREWDERHRQNAIGIRPGLATIRRGASVTARALLRRVLPA